MRGFNILMKKQKVLLLVFSTLLITTTVTSVARLVSYAGNGLSSISSYLEAKMQEEDEKEKNS